MTDGLISAGKSAIAFFCYNNISYVCLMMSYLSQAITKQGKPRNYKVVSIG